MFLSALVGLAGTAVSAMGTIAGANAQANALEYQSKIARQKGMQQQASAQREALESRRKGKIALSQLQARASASGAGADDPTVSNLAGDIGGRSSYQAGLNQWQGNIQKWDNEADARAKDAQASATRSAGQLSAFGTILGGASSLFKAFGSGSTSGSTLPGSETTFTTSNDDYFNRQVWWAN